MRMQNTVQVPSRADQSPIIWATMITFSFPENSILLYNLILETSNGVPTPGLGPLVWENPLPCRRVLRHISHSIINIVPPLHRLLSCSSWPYRDTHQPCNNLTENVENATADWTRSPHAELLTSLGVALKCFFYFFHVFVDTVSFIFIGFLWSELNIICVLLLILKLLTSFVVYLYSIMYVLFYC